MPNSSPTTSADLPLWSQFWTASRLKVSSNFRRSGTDVCFMNLSFHCSPDSLSVKSRYPHCSQAQLVVKIQLKGWNLSRESLAKIEAKLHKVTDTELLYFADVLRTSVPDLYPPVNGNGHLRESLEKLLERRKKPNPPSCSGS